MPTVVNPMTFNFAANYSILASRHSLKMGVSSIAINTDISNFHPQYGTDTYKGLFSEPTTLKAPSGTAGTPYKEAWALADFIYGARDTYELSTQHFSAYRQRIYGVYLQDDWRATEHLVINAGLRYEIGTPQYEANNQLADFDPASNTIVSASSGSLYNRSLQSVQYNNVGPRFGLAYSAGKTVLRGGYAISYIQFNRTNSVGELAVNPPFTVDSLQSQIAPAATGGSALCTTAATNCFNPTQLGYPTTYISPSAFNPLLAQVVYRPHSTPTGYVQSYQLSVQRELPAQFLLDLAYVGNHGVHELLEADYNQAAANAPGAALTLQARRPLATFGGVQEVFDGGTSNYNAAQAKIERRLRGGLYLLNSFTYARSFDQSAGPSENVGNNDSAYVNIRNLTGEYAHSSFDLPLLDVFSANWDLPFGYGRRFGQNSGYFANLLLGGWTLTTITSHASGIPFNIVYTPGSQAQQVSTLGLGYRPNASGPLYLATPVRTSTSYSILDPGAVSAPALNQPFGNLSRNAGRGLAYNSTDLGVHKAFPLGRTDTRTLEFRTEAFNLFNHVNWGLPDSNITDAAYGQITTALPARQLQFALRLNF